MAVALGDREAVAPAGNAAREVEPELWRRYLTIALQGLRPQSAPLEPLTIPTVPPERMEELLTKGRRSPGH